MLIVGAKGLAKEVLGTLLLKKDIGSIVLYDDVNEDAPDLLFDRFPVLRNVEQAKEYFESTDNRFTLGVGFPHVRYKLFHKFCDLGAAPYILVANNVGMGLFEMNIGEGVTIAYQCIISNSVSIGKGTFINANTSVGHDSKIGEFCEICPSVNISGNVQIGDFSFIGTGVIIYPNVKIGKNVSISVGSVVRKNVPDNSIVHGNPSKIIGKKPEFQEFHLR